jgi:hypothetical protein
MAKSKIDLEINISGNDSVAQAELKTKSLKTQLKEMKTLLASGTLDNNAFNKLANEAGKLQDRISDVNNEVKNLSNDSKNLTGIIGVAEGIAGGFAAVQGVTALLGDENEDLNKVMVKLQGSMAAVQGITAINNALQKDSAAMLLLANIQTKALALGQQFLKVTTMGTVAATYLLRAALIATGIGAIVVLVAALAGAFSDVAEQTEEAAKAQKEFNDKLKDGSDTIADVNDRATELSKARLKLNGATNDELIKQDIEALKYRKQTILDELQYVKGGEDEKNLIKERAKEIDQKIELKNIEIQQFLKDDAAKKDETRNTKNKTAQEKLKTENEKKIAEALQLEKNKFQLESELNLNARKRGMTLEQQEIADLRASYDEKRLLALNDAELTEKINIEIQAKTLDIQEKFRLDTEEKKKVSDKKAEEEQKQINEAKLQAEILLQDQKFAIANQGIALLSALGGKNKAIANAAFLLDKASAIGSIIINTQREIAGYYANPTWSLLPDGGATLKTSAAVGAKIRAGLSIATIAATSFGKLSGGASSGGGGGSTGGGSSQPAPIKGFIPQGDNNQLTGVSKVVVLEKDITDVQNRVARIRDNATLE